MSDLYLNLFTIFRALKNSIAEDPYFVMEFLDTLNTKLRSRSVSDYKMLKKANNNNVINYLLFLRTNIQLTHTCLELYFVITS